MTKGVIFAIIACILATYFGYHSAPGSKGVSDAINKAVVTIASLIVIVNYFLTEIMYGTQ